MGNRLVSRTAKVLSETKKTKDKEAVAIAYEHIPRNPDEQSHGSLYAVIELEDKSGHAEEIAEKIIDVLHDAYYDDTQKAPLEAFEDSLAKINDELADRSADGQINWLGKLNAVLGVLTGSTLHVTQTGKAEAYLYRNEHSMHITEDLAGDSINPQRTFINIASGDLSENDRIALVTPGIFYKVSKSELKKFATETSPKNAAENLSKMLSSENGVTKPNAVLLMEMVSPESFAADDATEEIAEAWVKEDSKKLEEVGTQAATGAVKFFDTIGKGFSVFTAFMSTKAVPTIKKGAKIAGNKISDFRKVKDAERVILDSEEKIHDAKIEEQDLEIDRNDGILEPQPSGSQEIRIKESKKTPKFLSLERFDFSFFERTKGRAVEKAKRFRMPGFKFSGIYLVIGVGLIIGIFFFVVWNSNIAKDKENANNLLTQATTKYEDALSEISSRDYRNAVTSLGSAEDLANQVLATKYLTDEARALIEEINSAEDSARMITRNSASLFYEFSDADINLIYTNGTLIYGLSKDSGSLYSLDSEAGTQATIVKNPEIDGSVSFATFVETTDDLVIYTSTKKVYAIDVKNGDVSERNTTSGWENAVSINYFGTNIYLLSVEEGQIFKHFRVASGYGQKVDYFSSSQNLSGIVDMAIDGSIYTVDSSANVKKYTSGALDNYNLVGLPEDYSDIKGMYANLDTEGIYFFSDKRIIKISEDGSFVAQYENDNINSIENIFVDEDSNTIYVSSENNIYTIRY